MTSQIATRRSVSLPFRPRIKRLGACGCAHPMGRLHVKRLRGIGQSIFPTTNLSPNEQFGGTLINYVPVLNTVPLVNAVYQDATGPGGASATDLLYNAFIGGPLNALGLVSTPLTNAQLAAIAADTGAGPNAALLTPAQQAAQLAAVTAAAATPPQVDLSAALSSLTAGLIPTGVTTNWVIWLALLAGGGFVAYKIFA